MASRDGTPAALAQAVNMQLQKKINKLQVEHVSEEEVDQLFYALEMKEKQLEQISREKESPPPLRRLAAASAAGSSAKPGLHPRDRHRRSAPPAPPGCPTSDVHPRRG